MTQTLLLPIALALTSAGTWLIASDHYRRKYRRPLVERLRPYQPRAADEVEAWLHELPE